VAPVEAVRGDHDHSLGELPLSRELVIGGKRIVLVHGNRSHWVEEPNTLAWTLSLGYFRPNRGLARTLRRRFPTAHAIVYGHTHIASSETLDGVLLFNPGGVHQWNPTTATRRLKQNPGWFEWSWLQVARHLRHVHKPTVGILEVSESGLVHQVIEV
jgi:predicted phosphodiesterase